VRKSSKRRLTNQEVDKLKDIEKLLPELQKKKSKQKHQHIKVEPIKQVDIVNDYIGKIETLMQKYDQDCQKLAERQSYYDKLISEHYHKVETMKFNACEGYHLSKQLQELLQKRRVIKNEMYRLNILKKNINSTLGDSRVSLEECTQRQREWQKNWKHEYTLEEVL